MGCCCCCGSKKKEPQEDAPLPRQQTPIQIQPDPIIEPKPVVIHEEPIEVDLMQQTKPLEVQHPPEPSKEELQMERFQQQLKDDRNLYKLLQKSQDTLSTNCKALEESYDTPGGDIYGPIVYPNRVEPNNKSMYRDNDFTEIRENLDNKAILSQGALNTCSYLVTIGDCKYHMKSVFGVKHKEFVDAIRTVQNELQRETNFKHYLKYSIEVSPFNNNYGTVHLISKLEQYNIFTFSASMDSKLTLDVRKRAMNDLLSVYAEENYEQKLFKGKSQRLVYLKPSNLLISFDPQANKHVVMASDWQFAMSPFEKFFTKEQLEMNFIFGYAPGINQVPKPKVFYCKVMALLKFMRLDLAIENEMCGLRGRTQMAKERIEEEQRRNDSSELSKKQISAIVENTYSQIMINDQGFRSLNNYVHDNECPQQIWDILREDNFKTIEQFKMPFFLPAK